MHMAHKSAFSYRSCVFIWTHTIVSCNTRKRHSLIKEIPIRGFRSDLRSGLSWNKALPLHHLYIWSRQMNQLELTYCISFIFPIVIFYTCGSILLQKINNCRSVSILRHLQYIYFPTLFFPPFIRRIISSLSTIIIVFPVFNDNLVCLLITMI